MQKHCQGFVDKIGPYSQMARALMKSWTKIRPKAANSPNNSDDISDLILEGLSYTQGPWSSSLEELTFRYEVC